MGNGEAVSDGSFRGGNDTLPEPRDVEAPAEEQPLDCFGDCRTYCDGASLDNPVNAGICSSLWGQGLEPRPINRSEACRRLHVDFTGRFPTASQVARCRDSNWSDVVKSLIDSDEFVLLNQRRWADKLAYNNRAVNFERAFDMDDLVAKAYRGKVSWDEFASVVSAHPILVRRHDTPSDRVAALYELFLGRPPYENERGDIGRLYSLWSNGYWEHPHVGTLPDAFIDFRCVDENGEPDPQTVGECTSILFGHRELTLKPDPKRQEKAGEQEGMMWAGFLEPDEWKKLQLPGRLIARQPAFWEFAVDEALEQYLGYNLAVDAPEVRHELVKYILEYNGDIRALHFAIGTSAVYLQSSSGGAATERRWTYGPLKQIQVEGWLDTIKERLGWQLSQCDHRLPHPEDYVGEDAEEEGVNAWGRAMVRHTRWDVDGDREVVRDYQSLAQTLGGCPSNEAGGRFTTISVLNTAVQESFVAQVCGIGDEDGVELAKLLPDGMRGSAMLDDETAAAIATRQFRLFLGRSPSEDEIGEFQGWASQCTPAPCDAAAFARPVCFATLSSSEMLFY